MSILSPAGGSRRPLLLVPPGPEAEHEPAGSNVIERCRHVRQERGMTVRVAEDKVSKLKPTRSSSQGGGEGPTLVCTAALGAQRNEMVEQPAGVEDRHLVSQLPRGKQRRPIDVRL